MSMFAPVASKKSYGGPRRERPTSAIVAVSNKPSKNNDFVKKRVGCREAKRLEQLDACGDVLGPNEKTMFRALAARCTYLNLDRPDVMLSDKELCRDFASPTKDSTTTSKRLVQYVVTRPRIVWEFFFEDQAREIDTFSDTDFGGCMRTRRSTSGGVAGLGSHVVKVWSNTQTTVALSSAEAGLTGICQAAGEGLGLHVLYHDLGLPLFLRVHSGASAAIWICRRRGLGRARHLAMADLSFQRPRTSHCIKPLAPRTPRIV